MLRLIPFAIAAVAIAVLTYVEGKITDRWIDGNIASDYCASLLTEVPDVIGDWEGVDGEVDEEIQRTAGAQGYVSRVYKHKTTGQQVDVWLIVGHARDTAEHTPDSCYPSSGFDQKDPNAVFDLEVEGEPPAQFWTAVFQRQSAFGVGANRVFWAWFKPTLGEEEDGAAEGVEWIAPENARFFFGSTRALYKLYFTAQLRDTNQAPDESVCLEFAGEFLPIANEILERANRPIPAGFVATPGDPSA